MVSFMDKIIISTDKVLAPTECSMFHSIQGCHRTFHFLKVCMVAISKRGKNKQFNFIFERWWTVPMECSTSVNSQMGFLYFLVSFLDHNLIVDKHHLSVFVQNALVKQLIICDSTCRCALKMKRGLVALSFVSKYMQNYLAYRETVLWNLGGYSL